MSANVREAALNSLIRCEQDGRYSNIELDSAIRKYHLEGLDRAFFTTLVYGVIERRLTLDYLLRRFSARPLEELDLLVLHLLRLGAYQILYLDRTPDRAAVNETVEQAKRRCNAGSAAYINGVLRSLSRSREQLPWPDPHRETLTYLSVRYSVPEWICAMWRADYGAERAEQILAAVNRRPHITLRVNTLRISREALAERLAQAGIETEPVGRHGLALQTDVPIDRLPLEEGLCFVQDPASQRCAELLDARPGERVLDCCACPGGKSFSIAIGMENQGGVFSADLHENKLSLIRKGAQRLGISIITTGVQDGRALREDWIGAADRVLCDVPCSGLGVMAKKPDLRYKREEEIARLPEVQYAILDNAARYCRIGGHLVYSTCTLRRAENEAQLQKFAACHPEYAVRAEETVFPDGTQDGFYMALLEKQA